MVRVERLGFVPDMGEPEVLMVGQCVTRKIGSILQYTGSAVARDYCEQAL